MSASDVTHRKRAEDFGNLKKKLVELRLDTGREKLTFACWRRQVSHEMEGQMEKPE